MARTKIKRDIHGQYVRTNGSVYRPQMAKFSHYIAHAYPWRDGFRDGEVVIVTHVSQTPNCSVRRIEPVGYREVWHSHGSYVLTDDGKLAKPPRKSEECWDPKE